MLNSKKCTLSKITTTTKKEPCEKKNLVEFCKKNSKKKFPKKKFKKKLKKGYQDFHAPKQGGGGQVLYKCVMVIVSVYGYIDKQNRRHRQAQNRHKNGDMEQRAETERFNLLPICLELSGVCGLVGLLWLSGLSGSDFLPSHKKIF